MGCITSSQKDVDNSVPTGAVKALSVNMKTRFANIDEDALGDYKEEAEARLAFVYGRAANIFIITTPAFNPTQERAEDGAHNAAEENNEGAAAAAGGEGEGERKKAEEAPAKEIRWTIFNDSKSDAKVEFTFFHGEALRSANGDKVKTEQLGKGTVRASVDVPAGATVPFMEGPIKGCMYKCLVYDTKTNGYELAAAEQITVS